ncbi:MAG TPA: LysM domain-containing protein [Terrimicrobiaceae bacterium]
MKLLRLAGFGIVGFVALCSAWGGDLSQEYNQVRKIALKDPKVRAAFDRANEKLNKRIIAIDPALKPYIEGQGATKTSREWRKQSPDIVSGASASTTHIVAKGETLTSIAKRYRVSVNDLTKANRTSKEKTLQVGQKLVIPSAAPR